MGWLGEDDRFSALVAATDESSLHFVVAGLNVQRPGVGGRASLSTEGLRLVATRQSRGPECIFGLAAQGQVD